MPVYNGERFLAEAIESILGQTFGAFEFVIIDDGSTDASPTILADYASRDPRIRVVTQANAGIVAALNRGLAECRAPLVARMDADDVSEPDRLAAQTKVLRGDSDLVLLGTAIRLVAESGRPGPVVRGPACHDAIAETLQRGNCIAHPTVIMRRDAVMTAGGYREELRHAEDYDLWSRLAPRHRLANLPHPFLRYRIHESQASWESAEIQAIRTIATRLLAAERRTHGQDSVERGLTNDSGLVRRAGVSDQELTRAIVDTLTGRATLCGLVGMTAEVRAIEHQLHERLPTILDEALRASVKTRLLWAACLSHRRNGRFGGAAVAGVRCGLSLLTNPVEACRLARRRLTVAWTK